MIAIPVESQSSDTMSTKLFGNAQFFALVDPKSKTHSIIPNEGCGNGIKTASFLVDQGTTSALYGFLGDGPFHLMVREGIEVYWLGKETMPLKKAIETALSQTLIRVTPENAKEFLDPGTAAGACECGCSHD
ncbi:NifB/NifX family molybdenum-iron cluster-binding protein [Sulfuricurvum sp.]|uniref:NifB/NifX family molybdenum-iron cluster-binding protein n=1 Tax=Sulfuricurvum sp. TaxID=2025608 RepID=UPI002E3149DE|nr:NifB/NifX family molybdenum-iron cluster-binding protein [Sulfuricurvum sp.]HEX5330027.1 NifB/NifX family molybdenum-iron cluster-binding protein [Sulfuricurvum sp.]